MVVVDKKDVPKGGEHVDFINKVKQTTQVNKVRDIQLKAPRKNTMLCNKKCTGTVGNPQEIEDKGFLTTTYFLQFEVLVQGDVTSQVTRKD